LSIDVYPVPFDPEKGTSVYRSSSINLISLKSNFDKQAMALALAFSRWLGIDSLSIQRSNASKEKTYGDVYHRFLAAVQPPHWLVEKAIDSRFSRHFYSEHERSTMVVRWTRGPSERYPRPGVTVAALEEPSTRRRAAADACYALSSR